MPCVGNFRFELFPTDGPSALPEQVLQPDPIIQRLSSAIRKAAIKSGYIISDTGFEGWSLNGFSSPLGKTLEKNSDHLVEFERPSFPMKL